MSADNWTLCPLCRRESAKELARKQHARREDSQARETHQSIAGASPANRAGLMSDSPAKREKGESSANQPRVRGWISHPSTQAFCPRLP